MTTAGTGRGGRRTRRLAKAIAAIDADPQEQAHPDEMMRGTKKYFSEDYFNRAISDQTDALAKAANTRLEAIRKSAAVLLDALEEDNGSPNDFDGCVGWKGLPEKGAEMALTFEMMTELRELIGGDHG